MTRRRRSDAAFTLIELMVVVLVVAILIGLGVVTFLGARTRAQDAAAKTSVRLSLDIVARLMLGNEAVNPTTMAAEEPALTFVAGASTQPSMVSVSVASTIVTLAAQSKSGACLMGTWTPTGVTQSSSAANPCTAGTGPVVTGLVAWFDAADPSSVTTSGVNVTKWLDKSGNLNDANASAGVVTYATAATNGLNAVRFNGSATLLAPHSASLSVSGTGLTIFTSYKATAVSGSYAFINKENTYEVGENAGGASWTAAVSAGCWVWVGAYAAARNAWHTNSFRYSQAWSFTVDSGAITTFIPAPCTGSISTTTNGLTLGGRTNGTAPSLTGDIGEVLIYNRALSDAEIDQVRGYLKAKWGTP